MPATQAPIHLCLISDNLPANLIPVLMDRPAQVYLLASGEMSRKGLTRRFQELLQKRGIAARVRENVPTAGLRELLDYARRFAGELTAAHADRAVVLNATGGNKLMALAFVEVFRERPNVEIIYTDTQHRVVESLTKQDHPTRPMPGVLDVPTYLAAHGLAWRSALSADPVWRSRAEARKPLSQWLAHHADGLEGFLGALNALARAALDKRGETLTAPAQHFQRPPRGYWRRAIERIAAANLIAWAGGAEIRFRDAEAARYLNGFWLEEYAWRIVRDENPDDVQAGVEGTWEGNRADPSRNEFDLLTVHGNRMLVAECKTARFGREERRDQDILYKLDSLGRTTGGLFGRRLLLSARPLPHSTLNRARSQGIEVIQGADLGKLGDYVRAWMRG